MSICQSCGMPMENETLMGRNVDGTVNEEYCVYCYPNGAFNKPEETFEEMIETCIPFMVKEGMEEAAAKEYLVNTLKPLKRWTNS